MARIVLSTLGSLGDLHPMLALGLELRRRGHQAIISSLEGYRETATGLGLDFAPLRPEVDESDKALIRRLVDDRTGPETVIRELVMPNLSDMYYDLSSACESADVMITGELIYVAASLAEKTGIQWVSTSLSPITMFSAEDPSVYPGYPWMEYFRLLPAFLHRASLDIARMAISHWLKPFKEFRRSLGLDPNVDPMFVDKYSSTLHLAMFSKALARPQTDWPSTTLQTGFCYYDESETTVVDGELEHFLNEGEAPIVFTLGSAAVLDAGDFFEVSAAAAKRLGKRAVLLYGRDQPRPAALNGEIAAFEFAPYSRVFPRAACVVHQGGVGTTGQALKAGVPQLIVPFSHDQPDNAARCRRAGVAEIVERRNYAIGTAHNALLPLLEKPGYRERASELKGIVDSEAGTKAACDAIEEILSI
jgi:UDP:flavonoid glycosyltransferase YjiC (YdhE family)